MSLNGQNEFLISHYLVFCSDSLKEIIEFLFSDHDMEEAEKISVKEFARTFLYGKDWVSIH